MRNMLEAIDVTKQFSSKLALDGVSLKVVIPTEGAPLKRDEGAPHNGMMAPPDYEMIAPPCNGMIPPG
jgi:hypothetical protein